MLTLVNRAYPTVFGVENPVYSWQGTLPTIDAMGKSVCSTVNSPSHVTIPYKATITPSFKVGTKDKEDPFGYIYSLDSPVCFLPANPDLNPNDAAPKLCQAGGVCGAHAESTALYLTETSSSVESVPDAATKQVPTPKSSNPEPTPSPKTPEPTPSPDTPAPKPNTPAPNSPTSVPYTPASVPAVNTPVTPRKSTTLDAAAGIGALLNPGSQQTPAQAGSTQPAIQQPTAGTPTQPAAFPLTQNPSPTLLTPATVIIVGSSSIVANSDSVFVISGQSLSAGGAVIVGGTSIVLGSAGSAGQVAVVGGVTQQVQTVSVAQNGHKAPASIITFGGQAITANSNSAFVVGGQTVAPGSAVIIAGTTVSVLQSGVDVVINGETQTIQAGPQPTSSPILTLSGQTYAANSQSAYVIAGQTLAAGKTIVISGTTIALASTGGVAVINGVTQTIASSPGAAAAILTINGQAVTANSQSNYVVSGQTLAPGHEILIGTGSSATTLSLATDAAGHSILIVNGKTSTFATGAASTGTSGNSTTSKTSSTSTNGVGDYIASGIGFGSTGTSTSTSAATTATAGAVIARIGNSVVYFGSLVGIFGAIMWV